jgi:hypothetical protein
MKSILVFLLFFMISCFSRKEFKVFQENYSLKKEKKSTLIQDSLFTIGLKVPENFIKILPPKNSTFELPDSSAQIQLVKNVDFNTDGKKDLMVNFGACGKGACMYGLFLNQYDNKYTLAFFNYLQNIDFKIEKNGMWNIESSDALEPYDPSKIQITVYKYVKNANRYLKDTTYVYSEK